MATAPPIPGTDEVLSEFGWWPSFHDAEVIHFTLSRGATPEERKSEAQLDVQVREYETRHAGTAQYAQALIKNVVIQFAFAGVEELHVEDFNFQNVINSLNIRRESEAPESKIRVEVESIYGFSASFVCSTARVASVSRFLTSEA
ncbi:Imm50 family immunity protein [Pseudaquabacterium inlustre]|uniref:Imm50 family immunity protein n=1 Tax=Pseudaquabacterium inlustre TaxID=2984192 RepID=UPI003BFA236C